MTVSLIERGLALAGLPSEEIAAIARITGGRYHNARDSIPQEAEADVIRFEKQKSMIVFSAKDIFLHEPDKSKIELTPYFIVPFEEYVLLVAPEDAPQDTPMIRIENGVITREVLKD